MISKAKLEELKFKWKTEDSLPSGTLDECFKTISTLYQENEEYAFHLRKAQERLSEVCKENEELKASGKFMGKGYYRGMEETYSKRIDELMAENKKLERVAKAAEAVHTHINLGSTCSLCEPLAALPRGIRKV